jgi:spermidine/putrescine-binding protein
VVLKNAPHLAEAKQLLNSIALNSEGCAKFATTTHYGCVNKRAYDLMPAALTDNLPGSPQSLKIAFVKNTAWWAENLDETVRQFRAWQRT